VDALEVRLADAVERVDAFNRETERLIAEEMLRHDEKRAGLARAHEHDLVEFEDRWNDEEFLLRFAKPSTHLLQIKAVERSLILQKDLERAEAYRVQVAQLEKAESAAAQERAEAEMRRQRAALLVRHDAEKMALKELCERGMRIIVTQREHALEPLVARMTTLKAEVDAAKHIRFETLPPLTQVKAANPTEEATMTPRTVQRYSAFKTNVKHPKIVVKPLGNIIRKKRQKTPEDVED
jgi:hypothetical protein